MQRLCQTFCLPVLTVLTAVLLALSGTQAIAGAWPRGEGNIFISSAGQLTWPKGRAAEYPDIYGSGYAEYGLGPRLTAGLDLGSADATRSDALKAVGFLRYSLSAPAARHQIAVDLGGGTNLGATVLRIGAAYGRGFEWNRRNGWVALDWVTLHEPRSGRQAHNLDATLGLSLAKSKLIAQLSGYQGPDGRHTASFSPSYVRRIGSGRFVEIGVVFGLKGKPDPALKLGVWQEF